MEPRNLFEEISQLLVKNKTLSTNISMQQLNLPYPGLPLTQECLSPLGNNLLENTVPCLFLTRKDENGNFLQRLYSGNPPSVYKTALEYAINQSSQSIDIMTPQLTDLSIIKTLANACNRGIEIYILTNKTPNFTFIAKLVSEVTRENQNNLHIRWSKDNKEIICVNQKVKPVVANYFCIDNNRCIFSGSTSLSSQHCPFAVDFVFHTETSNNSLNQEFSHDFGQGIDFFDDAYANLYLAINQATIRINNDAKSLNLFSNPDLQREKACNLYNILAAPQDPSLFPHEKIYILLENCLSHLQTPTGVNWRKPISYNTIMVEAERYGLSRHLNTANISQPTQVHPMGHRTLPNRLARNSPGLFPLPSVPKNDLLNFDESFVIVPNEEKTQRSRRGSASPRNE